MVKCNQRKGIYGRQGHVKSNAERSKYDAETVCRIFWNPNPDRGRLERGLRHMSDYLMRLLVYKMETEGRIRKHPEWEGDVEKKR